MALTLGMVTVDTQDARELARWWADQTGGELDDPYDGWFVTLKGGGLPVMLAFQKVDDPTPGKNRVHLDLTSGDVDAEVDRLVAAGATLVERRGEEGFRWVTMSDPHGNLFDVAAAAEATTEYAG
jgi:DNA-binding MarR family transcriptional regulator